MSGFPILSMPPKNLPSEKAVVGNSKHERTDAHLRSAQSVNGYHIEASDGTVGHVCDFMMDDKSWAIGELVVKTGHRFSGNEVLIPVSKVDRFSYEKSTVFVNLTKAAVEQSPSHQATVFSAAT
jgi:sporulation protein YlmC with PRC-barrel domain